MLLAEVESLLPSWMLREPRQRFRALMGGVAAMLDGFNEAVQQARLAGMPGFRDVPGGNGFDDLTALPLTGRDRSIRGGLAEEPWDWAARQTAWLDSWARGATPWMLLEQLSGILSPNPPIIRMVTADSMWWVRYPSGIVEQYTRQGTGLRYDPSTGTVTAISATTNLWDWDSTTIPPCPGQGDPSRFWVVIDAPCNSPYLDAYYTIGAAGRFVGGGGAAPPFPDIGPDADTIATTSTREHVELVRLTIQDWRAAGLKCQQIIVTFDPTAFQPTTDSTPTSIPDGSWGWPVRDDGAGGLEPSRFPLAFYWRAEPGGVAGG